MELHVQSPPLSGRECVVEAFPSLNNIISTENEMKATQSLGGILVHYDKWIVDEEKINVDFTKEKQYEHQPALMHSEENSHAFQVIKCFQ